jgi:ribosomal protein S12
VPDLPGVHYKAIKGKLDFAPNERFARMKRRSKFGIKKIKEK